MQLVKTSATAAITAPVLRSFGLSNPCSPSRPSLPSQQPLRRSERSLHLVQANDALRVGDQHVAGVEA